MNNVDELYEKGLINNFFYNKMQKNLWFFDKSQQDEYIKEAINMSSLGVSSSEEQAVFYCIVTHVPDIVQEVADLNNVKSYVEAVAKISDDLFKNREKYNIKGCFDLFCAVYESAKKIDLPLKNNVMNSCANLKLAYPQHYGASGPRLPTYNVGKWIQATRDIYFRIREKSESFQESFDKITYDWDKMEKLNYKYWLSFYNDGVPNKYPKLAQYHSPNDGFFVPNISIDNLKAELPKRYKEEEIEEKRKIDEQDVRDKIETQRSRIIGRLNSAERLLASLDGQMFAGDDQELMLKLLQDLKRKVQIANKISVKSSLFEDLIYRTGNLMLSQGNKNGALFFHKISQDSFDPFAIDAPPTDINSQSENISVDDSKKETQQAFREFFEMLEKGVYDPDDDPDEKANTADIVIEAQDFGVPPTGIEDDIPVGIAEAPAPEERPKQFRKDLPAEPPVEQVKNQDNELTVEDEDSDDVIEAALADITINDLINRLEMLVTIYKKREVSRQLSILDIMMDRLGLGSFFPSLGEAMAKSLESNQYISTRIEDILAKLKGSAESAEAQSWVEEKEKTFNPETIAVQRELEAQKNKEEKRRALRKQKDDQKLEWRETKEEIGKQLPQKQPVVDRTLEPVAVR